MSHYGPTSTGRGSYNNNKSGYTNQDARYSQQQVNGARTATANSYGCNSYGSNGDNSNSYGSNSSNSGNACGSNGYSNESRSSLNRSLNSTPTTNPNNGYNNANSSNNPYMTSSSSSLQSSYSHPPSYSSSYKKSKPSSSLSGGGPKVHGHPMAYWNECYVCAVCRIDISGEESLVQHCQGKNHAKKNRGQRGFAGLIKNKGGVLLEAGQGVIERCNGIGANGSSGLQNQEKLGVVALSHGSTQLIQAALKRNRSEKALDEILPPDSEMQLSPDFDNDLKRPHPDSHNGRKLAAAKAKLVRSSTRVRDVPDLSPPPTLVNGGPMREQREGLPVFGFRQKLLDTIRENPVVVVEGETGSGKTTQVPQYVLEDASSRGEAGNIIVAQPRRISAMSVAERVAAERGEPIGGTIGYTIRLESKASRNTRMLFCTTGILLKRLEEDKDLQNVTHVFIDEVHERSIESDFLLMVLKDLLKRRPLKLILMSATLDASLFHDYFNGAPSVKFPGRTYPVTELYLEHAMEVTQHHVDQRADWARKPNSNRDREGGMMNANNPDDENLTFQQLQQRYRPFSNQVHQSLSVLDHNAVDYQLIRDVILWLCRMKGPQDGKAWLENFKGGRQQRPENPADADFDSSANAILVFLPGIKEITTMLEMLQYTPAFSRGEQAEWILPIHSTVPPEDQRKVFTRPPPGVRKIVLATNIAETAITIDDVAFVVDTGRMKELRYDPLRKMASLEDCLVSRANARQRRGRAGRVREGLCVHLFTEHRHQYIAVPHQPPEVKRVPLEQLVLRIKALKYEGTAGEVCARLVEPPNPTAVARAVQELRFLEALTEDESLTALGTHLSTLPVDCRIGKLILLGAMFNVADEALTIAATLSYRSPFLAPIAQRDFANECKMKFALGQSDHLTALHAYNTVDVMGSDRYDFCRANFISIKTLQTIAGLKRQLLEHLSSAGFVRGGLRSKSVEMLGKRLDGSDGCRACLQYGLTGAYDAIRDKTGMERGQRLPPAPPPQENPMDGPPPSSASSSLQRMLERKDSRDDGPFPNGPDDPSAMGIGPGSVNIAGDIMQKAPILKALMVAALFPQLVIAADTKKSKNNAAKLVARSENGQKPEDIMLHPQCVAAAKGQVLDSPYLIYHEKVKTTRIFMRDATPVSPHALVLFGGGSLKIATDKQSANRFDIVLRLDDFVGLSCPKNAYELMLELRGELDKILTNKIENPKSDFSAGAMGLIEAVNMLLSDSKEVETTTGGDKITSRYGQYGGYGNSGGSQNPYGGNVSNQPMSFWLQCYKCKPCGVAMSGEIAFIAHCVGSKHLAKAKTREFCGLVPNDGGVTPVGGGDWRQQQTAPAFQQYQQPKDQYHHAYAQQQYGYAAQQTQQTQQQYQQHTAHTQYTVPAPAAAAAYSNPYAGANQQVQYAQQQQQVQQQQYQQPQHQQQSAGYQQGGRWAEY
ncbi:hypothetical protein TL16_g05777 [Triparma laevis f. inornata]|uniref:RNA helicase n=1 Tax=Triparma laevis f. inornata TaxID=1714386 RepID=A0A9W7AFN2_9STRA|nr:hypothetical protein TL16_g05777 [Triparma laevis f. inornata]